jgi:hypothetical protein
VNISTILQRKSMEFTFAYLKKVCRIFAAKSTVFRQKIIIIEKDNFILVTGCLHESSQQNHDVGQT